MLGDHTAHGRRWILTKPALANTKPEEIDHTLELLVAGEFLLLPSLPPFGKTAGIEFSEEGDNPARQRNLEAAPRRSSATFAGLPLPDRGPPRRRGRHLPLP
jgi:hypothetical protein